MGSLSTAALLPHDPIQGQAVSISSEDLSLMHVKAHRLPEGCFSPDATPGQEVDGIVWLGPNERLLIERATPDLPSNVVVTDVSHQHVALTIQGDNTTPLIETGTSATPTTSNGATKLRFGDITAIARRLDIHKVQLIVDASIAPWLCRWFADRIEQLAL